MVEEVEMITITKARFEKLREGYQFFLRLQAAGVDNWEGYSEACEEEEEDND